MVLKQVLPALPVAVALLLQAGIPGSQAETTVRRQAERTVRRYGYRVVRTYPHDPAAFTQGLEYRAGFLYESTGLEGRSSLRKVRLETGEVIQRIGIPRPYFGEGLTVLNATIVQLTWKHEVGFVYDQTTFQQLRTFQYSGEGWGLANGGLQIYMSDGTDGIRVLDPITLRETKRLQIREGGRPLMRLNELEFVRGEIFANVWETDRIVRISPRDGRVVGSIDLTGILSPAERARTDVLNGIAFDALGGRLFVTGKLWPKLFEIEVVPK